MFFWERRIVLLRVLVLLWCMLLIVAVPAWAGEAPEGERIFSANCSACHIGGNNVIISQKTLRKEALEKYGMNSLDAIKHQVYKGKSAMPAFGGRLSNEEIEAVAQYVLKQSEAGW